MATLTKIKLQNHCKKDQKRETSGKEKMPRNRQKRTGKSGAAQGENAEKNVG